MIRSALDAGDLARAADATLQVYGAEAFGFLFSTIDQPVVAKDAYAALRNRVRAELATFGWRSSLRAWIYGLAWREVERARRAQTWAEPTRAAVATVRLAPSMPDPPPLAAGHSALVAELRAQLAPLDREILILRLDRRLTWGELGAAWLGEGAASSDIFREARRFRGRFQQICAALGEVVMAKRVLPSG